MKKKYHSIVIHNDVATIEIGEYLSKNDAYKMRQFPSQIDNIEKFVNSYIIDIRHLRKIHESIIPLFINLQEHLLNKKNAQTYILPPHRQGVFNVLINRNILIHRLNSELKPLKQKN